MGSFFKREKKKVEICKKIVIVLQELFFEEQNIDDVIFEEVVECVGVYV